MGFEGDVAVGYIGPGFEGDVAVGFIGPFIWLDIVGSSFIHYLYKVKGYIYCLTG